MREQRNRNGGESDVDELNSLVIFFPSVDHLNKYLSHYQG